MNPLNSVTKSAFLPLSLPILLAALPSCNSTLEPFQKACEGVDCSGHGECQIQGGKAVCVCDQGYHADGLACVEDADPCEGIDCSEHGECVVQGGQATCKCDTGYAPDGLSCGETCSSDAECDDDNVCTDDSCDPATGCIHQDNTNPCDDGDACTVDDFCFEGACNSGDPPNCDDQNPCTDDLCDPSTGCINTNNTIECNDGNACTEDGTCSGGVCTDGPPVVEGTPCEDGLFCNGTDTCDGAGTCTHSGDPCGDNQFCNEADDICDTEVWYQLGGSASGGGVSNTAGNSSFPAIVVDDSGKPIIAWADDTSGHTEIYVKKYNGTSWVELGAGSANGEGVSTTPGYSKFPMLKLDSAGNPVAAWENMINSDDYFDLFVKRYEGGVWVDIGTGSASGTAESCTSMWGIRSSAMALDPAGYPTMIWLGADPQNSNPSVYLSRFDGNTWVDVGSRPFSEGWIPSIAIDNSGNPAVSWETGLGIPDGAWESYVIVEKYDGNVWEDIGGATGDWVSNGILAFNNDNIMFLVYMYMLTPHTWDTWEIHVLKYDGSDWSEVGTGSASSEGISSTSTLSCCQALAIDSSGNPVVAWVEELRGDNEIYIKRFDGSQWLEIGTGSASAGGISNTQAGSNNVSLAIGGGRICAAWDENNSNIFLRCTNE